MSLIGNMIETVIPAPYRILAGILVVAALLGGIYLYAYNRAETITSAKYELKIAKYAADKQQLSKDLADEKSLVRENTIIRYLYKIQEIHDKTKDNHDIAIHEVPPQNQMSNGWIYAHDQTALGFKADETKSKDPTPSGIMDNVALATVIDNYGICHEKDEQINALSDYIHVMQAWAAKVKAAVDKANKSALTK